LALSKRLIEAQRGTLGVESVVGMGSTFWMELPLANEPDPDLLPMDVLKGLLEPEKESAKAPTRTVLHIEDNESNRLLVELLLAQRPTVQLLSAACGQEGLAMACAKRPDLILLDMQLPDTSGEEVLDQLHSDERTRATPVVVISAMAGAARVRQLRAAGAADYLAKPFNVGQFLRVLDQHLVTHS
jgi:CheY-like chemotaxis protein